MMKPMSRIHRLDFLDLLNPHPPISHLSTSFVTSHSYQEINIHPSFYYGLVRAFRSLVNFF